MIETWTTDSLHNFYRISLHCQEILLDEQIGYQHIQVANDHPMHQIAFALPEFLSDIV